MIHVFIPMSSCSTVCHYCDHAVLLLCSSCPVDVQQSFTKTASFCLDTPVVTGISGKWLYENTKDWFPCRYEYYFIDWELLWLSISSFHTLIILWCSRYFLFQGKDGLITTSKTQVEILEDCNFVAVGLWNNMVSSTTETVSCWTCHGCLVATLHEPGFA